MCGIGQDEDKYMYIKLISEQWIITTTITKFIS